MRSTRIQSGDWLTEISAADVTSEPLDAHEWRRSSFWTRAKLLVATSQHAYLSPKELDTIAILKTGYDEWHSIIVNESAAWIGRRDSLVIVAFRGSDSLGDWRQNLNVLSKSTPWGRVHHGFLNAFNELNSLLKKHLRQMAPAEVWLTGHSLGGALACLAGAILQKAFPIETVMTFGQPAVGRCSFRRRLGSRLRQRMFRIHNTGDPIPRLPLTFRHVGQRIRLDSAGFTRCDVPNLDLLAEFTRGEFPDELAAELVSEGLTWMLRNHAIEEYVRRVELACVNALNLNGERS